MDSTLAGNQVAMLCSCSTLPGRVKHSSNACRERIRHSMHFLFAHEIKMEVCFLVFLRTPVQNCSCWKCNGKRTRSGGMMPSGTFTSGGVTLFLMSSQLTSAHRAAKDRGCRLRSTWCHADLSLMYMLHVYKRTCGQQSLSRASDSFDGASIRENNCDGQ